MNPISPSMLAAPAKALLLACFGVCLIHTMRGKHDLSVPFERLVMAFLALGFFEQASDWLHISSEGLSNSILALAHQGDLKHELLEAFRQASKAPAESGKETVFNIPAVLEQAWRSGVWGVMTAFVQGVFLIVDFVLQSAHDVLWTLLLFLFPLSAGVYPIFPRMMSNLALYGLELCLWQPVLCLIELVSGVVAKNRRQEAGSLGLYLVAVEVVAIILILMIPSIVHRFLSGAFAGDFDAQSSAFEWSKKVIISARPSPGGGA